VQIELQEIAVLESIKNVFFTSLEKFQTNINSASKSFHELQSDTKTKIARIAAIIHQLEVQISACRGKISQLNSQLSSYEAQASSARSSASSAQNDSDRNHYLSEASYYEQLASQTRHEISVAEAELIALQGEVQREKARKAKTEHLLSKVNNELQRYSLLQSQVSAKREDIFNNASRKLQNIQRSAQDYVAVTSNITTPSNSNENSNNSFSTQNSTPTAAKIEIFQTKIGDDTYTITPKATGKRFKCKVQKNSNESDLQFNFKVLSDEINLLSFSSNSTPQEMQVINSFLTHEAEKQEITKLTVWADNAEIAQLQEIGFKPIESDKDGAEMAKSLQKDKYE
jgi:predicted  nucleic acid-binding Zn-ribbon protein